MDSIGIEELVHENEARFRKALRFTADKKGFSERLIEKDYYCSLVLHDLERQRHDSLVFKGGTCLCKVHAGFYRLSEDLDFLVSTEINASRSERRQSMAPLKSYFKGLPEMFSGFQIQEDLRGHNNSKQYIGGVSYRSVITGKDEKIKIEISLREPVLEPVERKAAQTLLLNPQTNNPMFDAIKVNTLSYRESYAEKFRAALTRREPVVRDIYDIEMALRSGLDVNDSAFIRLIQKKLAVPGTDPVNLFLDKAGELRKQQEGKLKPVLRDADYQGFNIEKTLAVVTGLVDTLNRLEQGSRQRIKSP